MKNSKLLEVGVGIVLIFILLPISIYNIKHDLNNFLSLNVYNLLSIVISCVIAYYLVQLKSTERKKVEVCESLINRIQKEVLSEKLLGHTDQEAKYVTMSHKSIRNKITNLRHYASSLKITDEINYINDEFEKLRDAFSNNPRNLTDEKMIEDYKALVLNCAQNIDNKCEDARSKIYKVK